GLQKRNGMEEKPVQETQAQATRDIPLSMGRRFTECGIETSTRSQPRSAERDDARGDSCANSQLDSARRLLTRTHVFVHQQGQNERTEHSQCQFKTCSGQLESEGANFCFTDDPCLGEVRIAPQRE